MASGPVAVGFGGVDAKQVIGVKSEMRHAIAGLKRK